MQQKLLYKGILCTRYLASGGLIMGLLLAQTAVFAQDKPTLDIKIKPYNDNAVYGTSDRRLGYFIKLRNTINDNQRGNIHLDIKNSYQQSIYNENIGVFAPPNGVFTKDLNLDNSKFPPGFYYVSMAIATNHITQTNNYVFVVEPEKLPPTSYRPSDFSTFWDDAKRELVNINPAYQVTRRGDMSTVGADVFLVEFQSLNNAKIRGWLTVPKGRGKYPILYKLPSYANPASPETRNDVAVFSIDARGIGNSADAQKLTYDNYLITGLANKQQYIYRDVYMDCLRGLDFLFTHEDLKLDINKIIVKGEGQGAALAAVIVGLDGRKVKGLIMERPVFIDMRTVFAIGETQPITPWPVPTLKGYFNSSKTSIDNFFRTWDYFDPLNFATQIKCPILIGTSLKSSISLPQCSYNFYNQVLGSRREVYVCPDSVDNMEPRYYVFENNWTRETIRIPN